MSDPKQVAQLQELQVGGHIEDWVSIGFAGHETVQIGATLLRPTGGETPISGAILDGVAHLDVGLGVTAGASAESPGSAAVEHPNGVVAIDHVVVLTPDADRTQSGFEAAGVETRRIRRFETKQGSRRQTFHWLGDVVCEVGGPDEPSGDGPASWWGLALTVADIDATADYLGERASTVKDAVQPGRRVTTLRSSAGLTTPILFISAHPASASAS